MMGGSGDIILRLFAVGIGFAAMVLMATALALMDGRLQAMRLGVASGPWRQPLRDLTRLARKRRLRPGFASPLYPVWPVLAAAATIAAALIVPGFAFGTWRGVLASPWALLGLMAIAAMARIAAMLESGAAMRGFEAARSGRSLIAALAIWAVGFGVIAIRGGGDALGSIGAGLAASTSAGPGDAVLTVLIGLALALSLGGFGFATPGDYAGPERALFVAEAMLRRVVLISALVAVVAPMPMADARLVATWPLGMLGWIVKVAVVGVALAGFAPRRYAMRLAGAALCGALALVVLEQARTGFWIVVLGAACVVAGLVWLVRSRGAAGDGALRAASLMQGGVALVGLALAEPAGVVRGVGPGTGAVLILLTIGLVRVAGLLAGPGGWVQMAGLIALAGLPPFAGFAGDFAVVEAAMRDSVWLGSALLAGLVLAGAMLLGAIGIVPANDRAARAGRGVAAVMLIVAGLIGVAPWLIAGIG